MGATIETSSSTCPLQGWLVFAIMHRMHTCRLLLHQQVMMHMTAHLTGIFRALLFMKQVMSTEAAMHTSPLLVVQTASAVTAAAASCWYTAGSCWAASAAA